MQKHRILTRKHWFTRAKFVVYVLFWTFALQMSLLQAVCSLPKYHITDSVSDSVSTKSKLSSTIRLNSLGYFGFGGRIVSNNQSLDANIIYKGKKLNLIAYKVIDLYDHLSPNNFAMAMAFKSFIISNQVTITPYVGFVAEQLKGIADYGSDLASTINTKIKLNTILSLDHTAVLSNIILVPEHRDWVNRIRLIFDSGNYNVTWLGWHNNNVLDQSSYFSSGLSASYNNIPLSNKISMNTGLTAFKMIHASDEEVHPKKDGLLLSIVIVIE